MSPSSPESVPSPRSPEAPRTPPRASWHSATDVVLYERESLLYLVLLYTTLALALLEVLPAWTLAFAVLLVPRLQLSLHELMHIRTARQVHPLNRLFALLDTPVSLGYQEFRTLHLDHHRYPAEERDPEWYQIRGSHLSGLLWSTVVSERSVLHWVRKHGVDRELLVGGVIRLVMMGTALWLNPRVFLTYWVMVRAVLSSSYFIFHHVLHNRAGSYGTYPLTHPFLKRLVRVLLGKRNVAVVCEHDAHHAWPQVRAAELPGLLQRFPPLDPRGRESWVASALAKDASEQAA